MHYNVYKKRLIYNSVDNTQPYEAWSRYQSQSVSPTDYCKTPVLTSVPRCNQPPYTVNIPHILINHHSSHYCSPNGRPSQLLLSSCILLQSAPVSLLQQLYINCFVATASSEPITTACSQRNKNLWVIDHKHPPQCSYTKRQNTDSAAV